MGDVDVEIEALRVLGDLRKRYHDADGTDAQYDCNPRIAALTNGDLLALAHALNEAGRLK